MNTKWVIGILAAIVIIGGGYALVRNNRDSAEKGVMSLEDKIAWEENSGMEKESQGSIMETKNESAEKEGSIMAKEEDKMENVGMAKVKGAYVGYSSAALAEANKNGKTVLFFHAPWCPFCKAANEAFTSRLSEIPDGVTVLKTDYDSEKELKIKYGVTYQHTFVQVDAAGNMIGKWNGGDIEALRANIK